MPERTQFYAIILNEEFENNENWLFRYTTETDEPFDDQRECRSAKDVTHLDKEDPDTRPREDYSIDKCGDEKEYYRNWAYFSPPVKGRIYKMKEND